MELTRLLSLVAVLEVKILVPGKSGLNVFRMKMGTPADTAGCMVLGWITFFFWAARERASSCALRRLRMKMGTPADMLPWLGVDPLLFLAGLARESIAEKK